jgi:hypothetical protein
MNKNHIETFIKKYYLNGLFDKVRWVSENKTLKSITMSSDRKLFHSVELKDFDGFADAEVGILDTAKLKQILVSFSDVVDITLVRDSSPVQLDLPDADGNTTVPPRIISMTLSDPKVEFEYVAADLDVIEKAPQLKTIPVYDVELNLTDDFIESFLKAKTALNECDVFTLVMSKKRNQLEMVLGYSNTVNTNRASLKTDAVISKDKVSKPISFSAKALKEIISANGDVKNAVLKVSEQGLACLEYKNDPFFAQYYMIKIDTE